MPVGSLLEQFLDPVTGLPRENEITRRAGGPSPLMIYNKYVADISKWIGFHMARPGLTFRVGRATRPNWGGYAPILDTVRCHEAAEAAARAMTCACTHTERCVAVLVTSTAWYPTDLSAIRAIGMYNRTDEVCCLWDSSFGKF